MLSIFRHIVLLSWTGHLLPHTGQQFEGLFKGCKKTLKIVTPSISVSKSNPSITQLLTDNNFFIRQSISRDHFISLFSFCRD